jgi:hypothetical protein
MTSAAAAAIASIRLSVAGARRGFDRPADDWIGADA